MKTYKIIIPTKAASENLTGEVLRRTRKFFTDTFGGYTSYVGWGGWKDPKGIVMEEPVRVFEATYPAAEGYDKGADALLEFATYVRDALEQECVYVAVGDDVLFI